MHRIELQEYFKNLIENFSDYFEKNHDQKFTNQSINTCLSIYGLCLEKNPDYIIEIGTNYGASMFSLMMAMKSLNKNLSCITSIDLDHKKWLKSFDIQSDLINTYDLNLRAVKIITKDFNKVNPVPLLDGKKNVFIFYDMHDHKGPWSQRLLDIWYPLLNTGTIAVHDITPVESNFEFEDDLNRSKAVYKNGQNYAGFNECARIINWANSNNIELQEFIGGIYFSS